MSTTTPVPTGPDGATRARLLWRLVEPVHAVTYFAPASRDALAEAGTKGFWMGYFAARSAPLGAAPAHLVEATFFNFAPRLVRRAIPDAWSRTTPAAVLEARVGSAAIALRQLVPDVDEYARRAVPMLEPAAAAARCEGRPLAAANQALERRADPVERLWQAATTLREHRGDGHVAALVAEGISGLGAHVLSTLTSSDAASPERLRDARGWTEDEWAAAVDELRGVGLVDAEGGPTDAAHLLAASIEDRTDRVAWQPYRDGLTDTGLDLLVTVLRPLAAAIAASGSIPYPNPIGLPAGAPPRG